MKARVARYTIMQCSISDEIRGASGIVGFIDFFLLCGAATSALAVSVISDGVLTALRLPEAELSAEFLIPIFSIAIEVACAGALVFQIRSITQLATSTAASLKI